MAKPNGLKRLREIRDQERKVQALRPERDRLVRSECRRHSRRMVADAIGLSAAQIHRICSPTKRKSA